MYVNTHTGDKKADLETRGRLAVLMTLHYFLSHPEKCGWLREAKRCTYYCPETGNRCAVGKMLGISEESDPLPDVAWFNLPLDESYSYLSEYPPHLLNVCQAVHDTIACQPAGFSEDTKEALQSDLIDIRHPLVHQIALETVDSLIGEK